MANSPTTLAALILYVRQRTNTEVSAFITDAELTTYLNNSLAMLDTDLANKFNDYHLNTVLATIPVGSHTFSLPTDFLRLRGVDVWFNLSTIDGYRTLYEHSFKERNSMALVGGTATAWYGPTNMSYRLQGNTVEIIPASIATNWTYRVWYTPQYVPLVNTSDTLQTYMDGQYWTEYAVVDTCIKVLEKQDLDPATFMAQSAQLKEYIIKAATQPRNSGEPLRVVDTERNGGSYYDNWECW
jgi:hypothetical protein